MPLSKTISTFLVILTLCSTLITSGLFFYPNLTSYFLFSLLSKVVLIYSIVLLAIHFPQFRIRLNIITITFLCWIAYVYLNAHWLAGEFGNLKIELIRDGFLFFLALTILRSLDQLIFPWIVRSLTIALITESAICILQWLGIAESLNTGFAVTGSQTNPNITAIFLALGTSSLWMEFQDNKNTNRIFVIASFLLTCSALFLLECRSAIIGAFIIAFIFLSKKYHLLSFFRSAGSRWKAIAFATLLIFCLGVAGKWMYEHKQASADSRKEIWKTSLQMVKEKPVTGYGYGLFERNYNLYKGEHLKEMDAVTSIPSFAQMAYNEVLENAVEGGVAGAVLFLLLGGSAIYCYFRSSQNNNYFALASYAGIAAFFAMSMVNFTLQAIPAFALFVFFLSNLVPANFIIPEWKQKKSWQLKIALTFFLVISSGLFYKTVRLTNAFREHKRAIVAMEQGRVNSAVALLRSLKETLQTCESYHTLYGRALFLAGRFDEATQAFAFATKLTSHPDVYLNLGFCHQQLGEWSKAEENFRQTLWIMPERFLPRYALMELSIKTGKNEKALAWAHAIVDLPPKIPSKEVDFYKSKAESFIHQNTN